MSFKGSTKCKEMEKNEVGEESTKRSFQPNRYRKPRLPRRL